MPINRSMKGCDGGRLRADAQSNNLANKEGPRSVKVFDPSIKGTPTTRATRPEILAFLRGVMDGSHKHPAPAVATTWVRRMVGGQGGDFDIDLIDEPRRHAIRRAQRSPPAPSSLFLC